ncbi:MAG TPA: ABC transporter substrate-binding protein [Candidatus Limnocylindria bacterium]|nr:ABC transporter substrate-binding protein [Candidatus Limnocylindria bacterium]
MWSLLRTGLLAALTAASFTGAARAQGVATLRVATTPLDIGAEVLFAKDEGFFAKAGLDVDVELMNNGSAIAAAVASGAVDVAQANIVSLATAHERGIPFVLVAPGGFYASANPTTALVVAKTSPVHGPKDLAGKTIAISGIKNITQVAAQSWLARSGVDVANVHFIELPFPQMGPALAGGRVDAAVIAEPDLSDVLAQGGRVVSPVYDAIGKNFLVGAWFTTAAWSRAHPDLVRRFAAAIAQTAAWANTHQAESARVLEKYTKIAVPSGMRRATWAVRLDPAQVQPLIDASARTNVLRAPFPAAELIAPTH